LEVKKTAAKIVKELYELLICQKKKGKQIRLAAIGNIVI
jgi:hypothetical protein